MRCEHCYAPLGEHAVFCPTVHDADKLHEEVEGPTSLFDDQALRVGPYSLFPLVDAEVVTGRPVRGEPVQEGVARTWRVIGPDGVDHVIADTSWPGGQREVQLLRRLPQGTPRLDVIVKRVRLPLERVDDKSWLFFLKQARMNNKERPTLCKATPEQLSSGAGMAVLDTLHREFGLLDWGAAREIADHRPTLSKLLAGVMPNGSHAHLAAFVLTRIAPTARGYEGGLIAA